MWDRSESICKTLFFVGPESYFIPGCFAFFATRLIESPRRSLKIDLISSEFRGVIGQNHVYDCSFSFWCENSPPSSLLLSPLKSESRNAFNLLYNVTGLSIGSVDGVHTKWLITFAGRFVFCYFLFGISS